MDSFDEPNMKAGYCPVCSEDADIYAQGKWHCILCNWEGLTPTYSRSATAEERNQWRKQWKEMRLKSS